MENLINSLTSLSIDSTTNIIRRLRYMKNAELNKLNVKYMSPDLREIVELEIKRRDIEARANKLRNKEKHNNQTIKEIPKWSMYPEYHRYIKDELNFMKFNSSDDDETLIKHW